MNSFIVLSCLVLCMLVLFCQIHTSLELLYFSGELNFSLFYRDLSLIMLCVLNFILFHFNTATTAFFLASLFFSISFFLFLFTFTKLSNRISPVPQELLGVPYQVATQNFLYNFVYCVPGYLVFHSFILSLSGFLFLLNSV